MDQACTVAKRSLQPQRVSPTTLPTKLDWMPSYRKTSASARSLFMDRWQTTALRHPTRELTRLHLANPTPSLERRGIFWPSSWNPPYLPLIAEQSSQTVNGKLCVESARGQITVIRSSFDLWPSSKTP